MLTLFILSVFTACTMWEDYYSLEGENLDRNIWESIKEVDDFSDFVSMVESQSLDTLFESNNTYTLFVPSNSGLDTIDLSEMDPAGVLPDRVYTKEEMLSYLEYGRNKCRNAIVSLTEKSAAEPGSPVRPDVGVAELFLYNVRHVQHAAAQLNLVLRQQTDSAPRWVIKTD